MCTNFLAVWGRRVAALLFLGTALAPSEIVAQGEPTFESQVDAILARPEFAHAMFGLELYSLDQGQPVYSMNGSKLFTPASTTKLVTEGTALGLLGADYRFTTLVYRTGPVATDGTLDGDLVLVAAGDPNLSNRIQPDGTLTFENEDHAYAGNRFSRAVPGDPLAVIRDFARQIAAQGIKRVKGRVLVDASLFPEGARELGSGVVISPVSLNDNLVDVTIGPDTQPGDAVHLTQSPETGYVRFVNHATTGAPDSKVEIRWSHDSTNVDGSHTVTVTGSMPQGGDPWLFSYAVPQPSRYAEITLAEALRDAGVEVRARSITDAVDFASLAKSYSPENVVASHTSPPLAEEVKVTLKVSQNLHASMMPFILGSILGGDHEEAEQKGFDLEAGFLRSLGLDLEGASQGDGAGGAQSAFFTPDFMVRYLAAMAQRPDFDAFHAALPVLGVDGTLWNIQTDSPAMGHVFAKTGTFAAYDNLNRRMLLTAKGLAGFMTTADGRHLAFALYLNRVPIPADLEDGITKIAGQVLGEIAAAAYASKEATAPVRER